GVDREPPNKKMRKGATEERGAYLRRAPSGLLIRGFGVRVPGGAPVIKALTWRFLPDQSHPHVHSGRLGARWVLWSRWTKPVPGGRDGTGRTAAGLGAERGLLGLHSDRGAGRADHRF